MSRLSQIATLDAFSDADLSAGGATRAGAVALVTRAVEVSKAGQAKALFKILGRVARGRFLAGVLEVRVQPDADWSMIDVFVDTGSEVSRLAPTLVSAVTFAEITRCAADLAPLTLAGAPNPRRLRFRGPEPIAEAEPESDVFASALVFPEPSPPPLPPRKKSTAPPRPKSIAPRAAVAPRPPTAPAAPPRAPSAPQPAVRRQAPSDVKATVRADASAMADRAPRRTSNAPRAPRPDVKATIKVETVNIPKEAIGGSKAPPRELLRKVDRTSALIPRDEEED